MKEGATSNRLKYPWMEDLAFCASSIQIPIIPADGSIARGIEVQTHQALKNLGEVLKAAGCGFEDVVKTQVYLSDMADFVAVNQVYAEFFTDPFPARACIQAAALPKGVDVEIDAVARKRENR